MISNEYSNEINRLTAKLNQLLEKQNNFYKEIDLIRNELEALKAKENPNPEVLSSLRIIDSDELQNQTETAIPYSIPTEPQKKYKDPEHNRNLEKFIGENLISKIGIIITIIGLAIGTKYSIEHDLISPVVRILLGYAFSVTILLIGIKLKEKYHNYSAVLVSGAMASMYFITYSAFNYFELIPRSIAFALMIIFTIFTVIAALHYNLQIIAHVGMVGAYAVPFLLSDNSGNILVFFSYITIINMGILTVSLFKNWKPIIYVSSVLSWIIYLIWYIFSYNKNKDFSGAAIFNFLFFITFYTASVAWKIKNNEKFAIKEVLFILINSFIFYAIGYSLLNKQTHFNQFLGLYTMCNAVIHVLVGIILYKKKLSDKNLYYFITGLAIVFITIAIPVQFNGNWVTLLWTGQAVLLYDLGKQKQIKMYETLSLPMIILSFTSLVIDFNWYSQIKAPLSPVLFSMDFLSHLLCSVAYGYILYLMMKAENSIKNSTDLILVFEKYIIPAIFLLSIYYSFRLEITKYWTLKQEDTKTSMVQLGRDIKNFKTIYLYLYTFIFCSVLSITNLKWIKNNKYAYSNIALNLIVTGYFLTEGLFSLGELRDSYILNMHTVHPIGLYHILIRYIVIIFSGITLYITTKYKKLLLPDFQYNKHYEILIHTIILTLISNELITWLYVSHIQNTYKTILSILFGVYSLYLIWTGIKMQKQHLRIAAFILFGATLIKLFFYDLVNLSTIQKTIVFVSLGCLLLLISFLYNKFKPVEK